MYTNQRITLTMDDIQMCELEILVSPERQKSIHGIFFSLSRRADYGCLRFLGSLSVSEKRFDGAEICTRSEKFDFLPPLVLVEKKAEGYTRRSGGKFTNSCDMH